MKYIPAYFNFSFLESITQKKFDDLLDSDTRSKAKAHLELIDLIIEGINVKTDVSTEEIKQKAEEKNGNPLIKHLVKSLRISSAKQELIAVANNPIDYLKNKKESVALYGFSDLHHRIVNEYQLQSGYHCITSLSGWEELFIEQVETFKRNEMKSWIFAKRFLEPHNSIIIADPYLFKEKSLESLEKMFAEIIPLNIKCTYHVTLIGYDQNKKNDLPSSQKINNDIKKLQVYMKKKLNNIVIEHHIYNDDEFHDRYIITNNACIFSGYGVNILKAESHNTKAVKDSTWLAFKPFKKICLNGMQGTFFYKVMFEKLTTIKKWVENSSCKNSTNPLILHQ